MPRRRLNLEAVYVETVAQALALSAVVIVAVLFRFG